jgi:hypothetical protein
LPRSMRLRKSTEIPARSASCFCVRPPPIRKKRTRKPNLSLSWEVLFSPRTGQVFRNIITGTTECHYG